ncbi:MAG: chemotaxis protein CheB [Bacteroidota bacterium]|nr:chemotaxis protein CheB [Flavisolibacter sp.]MBD0350082.1 chemotaxis protein CheB [Flavisolibacter sp.]MDQ3847031.1 chemotaxis protein CheB [Bacteroidota bacterium]
METEPKYIVVIGASAGGLHSVIELAAQLTEEVDMAISVVLHTSNVAFGDVVVNRLQKNTVFTCKLAEHEESIKSMHLYLAPPDKHLIIKRGYIILGDGPAENRWRPSIDVLFRSAAVAYNGRVVGIVLTGMLEDGTAGMQIIKQCGGTCIVQDPEEAEYPDMPLSVLRNVEVDYCTSLTRIGTILLEKAKNGVYEKGIIPPQIVREAEIAEKVAIGIDDVAKLGAKNSIYSCPDCGGGLWEINQGNVTRYRCHTGHMYTQNELLSRQQEELEQTFYIALRMMEERRNLLQKMALEEESKGWMHSAANKTQRAQELQIHIARMKEILFEEKKNPTHSPGKRLDR